jgi:hypothetical protein
VPLTFKVGLTKFGSQNHLNIPKKNCISYQFRADIQSYGHRPQYTADNDAAEMAVRAQKSQVAAAPTIWPIRSS